MVKVENIFFGDSETAKLLRALDWDHTPLGPVKHWPPHLCFALRTCLASKYPTYIGWGKELSAFYNDAYISFLGPDKHPSSLGRATKKNWLELWDEIEPLINKVITDKESNWLENFPFKMDRKIPKEEVYVTFSYSPILNEKNEADGFLCVCHETTEIVLNNRRLETLRLLGLHNFQNQSPAQIYNSIAVVLGKNIEELPFSFLYTLDQSNNCLTLIAQSGLSNHYDFPTTVILENNNSFTKLLCGVMRNQKYELFSIGDFNFGPVPNTHLSTKAIVFPIKDVQKNTLLGMLIMGINPYREWHLNYLSFFELVASQVSSFITNAYIHEHEKNKAHELAKIDHAKTVFYNNISHEFRTPLALILGHLESLLNQREPFSEKTKKTLLITQRNAQSLQRLVNSFLDFSRLEVGPITPNLQPIHLTKFTHELASMFQFIMQQAALTFKINCIDQNELVYMDKEMWEKIIFNLLSNAYKFTLQGCVTLTLQVTNKKIILIIRDTGIGIAEHDMPKLFDRFYRIESQYARTTEGTGIGLALVKEFVQLLNGTISVQSELNKGSCFVINLEAKHVKRLPSAFSLEQYSQISNQTGQYIQEISKWTNNNSTEQRDSKNKPAHSVHRQLNRILIADDNSDMREYLASILATKSEVITVANGEQALAYLKQNHYDLLITDVMMPGLNGLSLLKSIRRHPLLNTLPIILISAKADESVKIASLEYGADDYLVKPFAARELIAKVDTMLKLSIQRKLALDHASLQKLHDLSTKLISKDALETLLQTVCDAAVAVTNADTAILQLYNSQTEQLTIAAYHGLSEAFLQQYKVMSLEHSPFKLHDTQNSRLIFQDLTKVSCLDDFAFLSLIKANKFGTFQTTKLMSRNQNLLGILSTFTYDSYQLDDRTLNILDLFSREAATLIEYRQREANLLKAKEEAELGSEAKDIFLATLSHELRTPLTVILTWVQILELKNIGTEKIKTALQAIKDSALIQNQLIEDLLDISRIKMQKFSVKLTITDITQILRKSINAIRPTANNKDIHIAEHYTLHKRFVNLDEARIRQVFGNILSNAIKFTPSQGRIEINISDSVDGKDQIDICIKDNGIGIKPDMLSRIFNRFEQADSSHTRRYGGLGIGLDLVRNIMAFHQGTVRCESLGEGLGTTIILSFPLVSHLHKQINTKMTGEDFKPNLTGINIILVEDDETTRLAIQETLLSFGATIESVNSAKAALQQIKLKQYHVLICDIGMPNEDGFSLINKIRSHKQLASTDIPAIALTAYADDFTRQKAKAYGFNVYITKPVNVLNLANQILQLCNTDLKKTTISGLENSGK